jgi:hypothetical protein
MKPIFEKVTVPAGASWTLFHRRLPSFPFEWHYHPEYELTFTLNSLGSATSAITSRPTATAIWR